MPTITIDPELRARAVVPGLGWIEGAIVRAPDEVGLAEAFATAAIRAVDIPPGALPAVAATRRAIKALGKDPARYRPAAEALMRRLAKGRDLPRILPVVDAGNAIALETGVSIGVYDIGALEPPLVLRAGRPGERYQGVDGQPLELASLPLLADRLGPFGSPVRDSERSRVTAATQRVLVVLYGFAPMSIEARLVERAAERLSTLAGLGIADTGLVPPTCDRAP